MQSPFQSIVHTPNYIPSPHERETIRQYLVAPTRALAESQAAIQTLESLLTRLRTEHAALHSDVNAHMAFISTFRQFPDDVLQEIFVHCLPDKHNATFSPADAPILVSHVCSRWREIALATPYLWTSLHVYTHREGREWHAPSNAELEERDQRVVQWLGKSGTLPLSLSLSPGLVERRKSCRDRLVHPNLQDLQRLLVVLAPFYDRLDELDIDCASSFGDALAIFRNLKDAVERGNLTLNPLWTVRKLRLRISFIVPHQRSALVQTLEALEPGRSARLQEVAIYCSGITEGTVGVGLDFLHPEVSLETYIPCSNLRVLELKDPMEEGSVGIQSIRAEDFFEVMRLCPLLRVFSANVDDRKCDLGAHDAIRSMWDRPRIDNQYLKDVSLSMNVTHHNNGPPERSYASMFFDQLDWPQVSSLSIRRGAGSRNIPFDPIEVLSLKLGHKLTALAVSANDIPDLLSALPYLSQLIQLHIQPTSSQGYSDSERSRAEDATSPIGIAATGIIANLTPPSTVNLPVLEHDNFKLMRRLCPRLQYLKWDAYALFDDAALCMLLHRRATEPHSYNASQEPAIVVQFKQIDVTFARERQMDIEASCWELVGRGLKLRAEYTAMRGALQAESVPRMRLIAKTCAPARGVGGGFGWP